MLLQDRIKYNAVFEFCQTCCFSSSYLERLFIKQKAIKPPILKINKTKTSQSRRERGERKINNLEQKAVGSYVASTLLVVCLLSTSIYNQNFVNGEQEQQIEVKTQTSLPTVIVRGFLVSTSV